MNLDKRYHELSNTLALLGVIAILSVALFYEFYDTILPCPLCYLQRVVFIAIGITLMMNLFIGPRPAHYGLMIFASALGLLIALRQISLHIMPNDVGYGSPVLGLHLYTWAAIGFTCYLLFAAFSLMFDHTFDKTNLISIKYAFAIFFIVMIVVNLVLAFLECGFVPCPDNPTSYRLLSMAIL